MADATWRDDTMEVVVDFTPPFVQYIVTSAEIVAAEVPLPGGGMFDFGLVTESASSSQDWGSVV